MQREDYNYADAKQAKAGMPDESSARVWKAIAAVAALALIGLNIHLLAKVNYVESAAESQREVFESQVAELETELAVRDSSHIRDLEVLSKQVDQSRRATESRAIREARRQSERVAQTVAEKQRMQQDMFLGEITIARAESDTNRQGIEQANAKINGVAGSIDEARRGLAETADVVRSTQSSVDEIAGRVGGNADQIERLWREGERELVRFRLSKSKARQRVDDVHLKLRSADRNKNRYTLEILADDEVTVHRDRLLNQPVAFYVTGSPRAYEIVVTSIDKNQVAGFLAKPKLQQMARN